MEQNDGGDDCVGDRGDPDKNAEAIKASAVQVVLQNGGAQHTRQSTTFGSAEVRHSHLLQVADNLLKLHA